jgi:CBS domain-containing protein
MPANTLVRDVMSTAVVTVHADDKVEAAADIMADKDISGLPVVDASGKLVGLLRDDDLIATDARVHVPTFINFLGLGVPFPGEMKHLEAELEKISGSTVGDLMNQQPPTVAADATIEDVASIMHDHGVNSLPVIDADRKVIGIIARADVVRMIARDT